jgi:hypothetical protein
VPTVRVEYASQRKTRTRNKLYYRFNHWPLWIFVFFIAPGPLTFDLFARGFDWRMALWLGIVMTGTAIAGLRGRLPGAEPKPSIIYFTEDLPNPLYRRICYTMAWSELIAFGVLNSLGVIVAVISGRWYLEQIYRYGYFPVVAAAWCLGAMGTLPRAKATTIGEGLERRQFYSAVWAVAIAHPVLWFLWKWLPQTRPADFLKLLVFDGILIGIGSLAYWGRLPRTRLIIADQPPGTN